MKTENQAEVCGANRAMISNLILFKTDKDETDKSTDQINNNGEIDNDHQIDNDRLGAAG